MTPTALNRYAQIGAQSVVLQSSQIRSSLVSDGSAALTNRFIIESENGTAFAALAQPLEPISQDAAAFFEDHVVISDEAGQVAVEVKAGLKVADWFKGVKAAIHQNHGLLTASRHSIEAAAFWFIALERCCQQQLLVQASGIKPRLVPPDKARYSREHVGSEYIGWLHFQTIWNDLLRTQPDMFD